MQYRVEWFTVHGADHFPISIDCGSLTQDRIFYGQYGLIMDTTVVVVNCRPVLFIGAGMWRSVPRMGTKKCGYAVS